MNVIAKIVFLGINHNNEKWEVPKLLIASTSYLTFSNKSPLSSLNF